MCNKPNAYSFADGFISTFATLLTRFSRNLLILYLILYKLNIMVVANISDFRKDIKSYFDRVTKNFETLIINRGKDSAIVVMSLEEYNSLMATNYELSTRANEKRLDSAIENLQLGKSFSKDIIQE